MGTPRLPLPGRLRLGHVPLCSPRKQLKKKGPVSRETMERIAGRLDLSLPPAPADKHLRNHADLVRQRQPHADSQATRPTPVPGFRGLRFLGKEGRMVFLVRVRQWWLVSIVVLVGGFALVAPASGATNSDWVVTRSMATSDLSGGRFPNIRSVSCAPDTSPRHVGLWAGSVVATILV